MGGSPPAVVVIPRVAAALVLAAGIAAIVIALALSGGSSRTQAPAVPLSLSVAVEPAVVAFGDPVVERVDVVFDRVTLRASTLALVPDVAPLTQLGAPTTTRTVAGRLETVRLLVRASCLDAACAARTGVTPVRLPPVRVRMLRRTGAAVTASVRPVLQVRSRVTAADLAAARPRLAADASPPDPRFAVAPSTLALALEIAAIVAAVAAAALAVPLLLRRRRPAVELGELERALRLVRESESRPPADRRRAVGQLARLLAGRSDALADDARRVAWSRPEPGRPALDELADRVEEQT